MVKTKVKPWKSGIAALLSLSMLAACGGNGGNTTGTSSPAPNDSQQTEEVELYDNGLPKNEEVTLKVGYFVGGYGRERFDAVVAAFTEKYPNVKIDVTASSDMKTLLSTRIQANNDNDMFDLFNTAPAGGVVALAEAGMLEPMDDIWDYYLLDMPDKTVREMSMDGVYDSIPLIDGKRYEFPIHTSYGGLFFNKKLFEENGWNQNPKTWEEFKELLAEIKADGVAPITFPGIHPSYYNWSFGAAKDFELADINGRVDEAIENYKTYTLPQYTAPETVETWMRMYELGQEGYFAEGLPALNHTQSQMQVLQGQAAMVSTGTHVENEMKEATPDGFEWGYMAIPFRDSEDQTIWVRSGNTGFKYIWANKPELNKRWAKELILFELSLDNQQAAAEESGALPLRKDLIEDPSRAVNLMSSAQAVLEYIADNDVRAFNTSRSNRTVNISHPSLAQAEKLMEENVVKFALGIQDPRPILEEAEKLLEIAVEAEKK